MTWFQARDYCARVGKRLPTQDEWELAAHGVQGRAFPWGQDDPADRACWSQADAATGERRQGSCPMGSFPQGATPQGILDLAGNVSEWTSEVDHLRWNMERAPTRDQLRFTPGGSWGSTRAAQLQSVKPESLWAGGARETIGLRCAVDSP